MKLMRETWFVDEMSLQNQFMLQIHRSFHVFLIVSDFCTLYPNLVDDRSAYLWPTSFERQGGCRMEELALPTHAIQLSGEVLSTDEATSAELCKAEAAHRARNSCRLHKATTTTPWVCLKLLSLGQDWNKHFWAYAWVLLHCGSPAEPRLLPTAVPQVVVVVRMGSPRTQTAHNKCEQQSCARLSNTEICSTHE